ncbi:PREDICTED: uncharacterized protein LOC104594604 isoform X2 [Nelumbo nucifera]|uniref:Uncharacterized protein LOC104594604 isoform X2 n=2 Tax=Nelumbo nucifera TaxID=4432 RepID=A0A1U7ZW25_NELNU|nr:PREDICTED: uncharacterized protein LOC104594604 isoform X2 [Nelumbo nucifera]DAD25904.1 TPA_asm: hypothetical protein HUJ06_027372 [Nelumbo nucifera]
MASHNNNFDSLLLQSLMGRLQLRSPYLHTNSYLSQSLEDLLLDNNSFNDDDDDDADEGKTPLAKEESKLEKEIIRIILSGKTETLKPNSGQAVTIGDHHICVGFHEETGSDYRVWEWHGHIMLFDEENGYTPEYIYGNYFERAPLKRTAHSNKEEEKKDKDNDADKEEDEEGEEEEKSGTLGLRELIDGGDSVSGRILRRNLNTGSPRF